MYKKGKKLIIEKRDTTTYSDESETDYTTNIDTDTDSYYQRGHGSGVREVSFQSIAESDYRKPRGGSRQDNMTTDEIRQRLKGFIPLKSMSEKKILTQLPLFRTWVRYINKDTHQFRIGGLLMKVEYPDYIMLANTNKNLTWSVQLKDNIFFIRNPESIQERKEEKKQDKVIKEQLFQMYKSGDLYGNKRK